MVLGVLFLLVAFIPIATPTAIIGTILWQQTAQAMPIPASEVPSWLERVGVITLLGIGVVYLVRSVDAGRVREIALQGQLIQNLQAVISNLQAQLSIAIEAHQTLGVPLQTSGILAESQKRLLEQVQELRIQQSELQKSIVELTTEIEKCGEFRDKLPNLRLVTPK